MLVREANEADYAYIFDTYLNTWRQSRFAGTIPNHLYFDTQRVVLEDLVARGAVLAVACPEEYPRLVQGWACYELKPAPGKEPTAVLHYLYERPGYQTNAVLLDHIPGIKPGLLTHRLPMKELREWKWIPEIARRKSL